MKKISLPDRPEDQYVISYLNLRKAVGILGIALPVVLIIGFWIFNSGCPLPPSISHYYYTGFSTYFTGTLCAVALFLFSYKGPESKDETAAMIASVSALGVAFFPTNPYKNAGSDCMNVTLAADNIRNALHYGFAALLFLTFAYFSLVLFTKTSIYGITRKKRTRNKIYIVCGCTILVCIATILVLTILDHEGEMAPEKVNISTFILEAVALFAFGFSWLVKGETFFRDKSAPVMLANDTTTLAH